MTPSPLARAQLLREQGATADARLCCEAILRDDPSHAEALNLMAALAADEGDFDAALHWAKRSLEADQHAASPHYTLGRIYQSQGLLAEAEASYRRYLGLRSGDGKAHNNLGCVLQMQGRLDSAIASFRQALTLDPTLAQALQNLASIVRDRD